MLTVFYGNDTVAVRKGAFAYVAACEKKGSAVTTIDPETYAPGIFRDAAEGSSLFGGTTVYVIDTPSQKKDMYEDVISRLKDFAESPHIFVIIEGALLAPEKKKLCRYAEKVEEYKTSSTERFNTFALADALARRDKKSLWLLVGDARRAGISDEEMIGVLWWQIKSMRLASMTTHAAEAGMKEFPYNKAKQGLTKFSDEELMTLSTDLLTLYHEARRGERDLSLAFERWTLTL